MPIEDIKEAYSKLRDETCRDDTQKLIVVSRMLFIPQRTISTALFCLFTAKRHLRIEPDDIVLHTACISLACKLCGTHRTVERILGFASFQYAIVINGALTEMYYDCINKTEVDICEAIEFDFEVPDYYKELNEMCQKKKLAGSYNKRGWLMINDVVCTPLCAFFTVTEIVLAVLLVQYLAIETINENSKESGGIVIENSVKELGEIESNASLISGFIEFMCSDTSEISEEAVEYILLEICELYKKRTSD
ncbi:hypothetical protein PAEPH01_1491 [Pancytospora epiphaga]|nr:hypothetical protein PAEPH01_1491 [Pancytospora epiphaga]